MDSKSRTEEHDRFWGKVNEGILETDSQKGG